MKRIYYPAIDAMTYVLSTVNGINIDERLQSYLSRQSSASENARQILENIIKLVRTIRSEFKPDSASARYYFSMDLGSENTVPCLSTGASLLMTWLVNFSSDTPRIDEMICERHSLSKKQRLLIFCSSGMFSDVSNDYLFEIIENKDESEFRRLVANTNTSDESKEKILDLYFNFDEHVVRLLNMLRPVVDIISRNSFLFRGYMERICGFFEDDALFRKFIFNSCGMIIPPDAEFNVYVNLFEPIDLSVREVLTERFDIYVGVAFGQVSNFVDNDVNYPPAKISEISKSLSESLRFNILCEICKRPLYGPEIAEKFTLSPAMVAYHMNKLSMSGLITTSIKDGKSFYSANTKNIDTFLRSLNSVLVPIDSESE